MPSADHAVVIGVNRYEQSDYTLTAPVPDALAFARWVTQPGAGRATKESLTLLLSPNPDDDLGEFAGVYKDATTASLQEALLQYPGGSADKPRRLWLFYAGHAIAPKGANPDQGPLLLPPDFKNITISQTVPSLPFEVIRQVLVSAGPAEQVIFIDACRKQMPSETGLYGVNLVFDTNEQRPNNTQAVLYATTNGSTANQVGRGLFSEALLKGLNGVAELRYDVLNEDYTLRFPALSRYVIEEVKLRADNVRKTQVPYPFKTPDLVLARFPARPRAKLSLLVRPLSALQDTKVKLRVSETQVMTEGPPSPAAVSWTIDVGEVAYTVEAAGYKRVRDAKVVYEDLVLPVTLEAAGLEATEPPPLDAIPKGIATLSLSARDRRAQFELFDSSGARVDRGVESGSFTRPTGLYRVDWSIPGEGVVASSRIELLPGATSVQYEPSATLLPAVEARVHQAGIPTGRGLADPSEAFGWTTLRRLGSLLSWAAMAARYPDHIPYHGQRLRKLGVAPIGAQAGESWMQVLIGDASTDGGGLLDGIAISFGRGGEEQPLQVSPLPGLPELARQATALVPDGGGSVLLSGAGMTPIALPVPHAPGWIAVIIVAREAGGDLEIHRYLHQASPHDNFSDFIRVREEQWRALERRVPITTEEAREVLKNPALDPLTAVVVGYRLWRSGLLGEWRALVDLQLVSVVPDAHILAAASTDAAASAGAGTVDREMTALGFALPIVAEGFTFLHRWLAKRAQEKSLPPPIPARSPLHGVLWTSFDAREDRSPVATPQAIPTRLLDTYPVPWGKMVQPIAEATVRIDFLTPKDAVIKGTAFFVGPSVLLTQRYMFDGDREARRGDSLEHWRARDTGTQAKLGSLLAVSERGHQWERKLLTLALVSCDPSPHAPPALSFATPRRGQRIAVIGFPQGLAHPRRGDHRRLRAAADGGDVRDARRGRRGGADPNRVQGLHARRHVRSPGRRSRHRTGDRRALRRMVRRKGRGQVRLRNSARCSPGASLKLPPNLWRWLMAACHWKGAHFDDLERALFPRAARE